MNAPEKDVADHANTPSPKWSHWLIHSIGAGDNREFARDEVRDWLNQHAKSSEERALRSIFMDEELSQFSLAIGLLACGADPTIADEHGNTALMSAAYSRVENEECVRLLLPLSDAKAVNCIGRTALMFAASVSKPESVRALLPHSDAKAADGDGQTALMSAAANDDAISLGLLLPQSDPNARGYRGKTALMHAAAGFKAAGSHEVDCVSLLLPVSDLSVRGDDGFDAFELAVDCKFWRCVDQFALFVSVDQLKKAVAAARAGQLPKALAKIESQELVEVVRAASQPQAAIEAGRNGASQEKSQSASRRL